MCIKRDNQTMYVYLDTHLDPEARYKYYNILCHATVKL